MSRMRHCNACSMLDHGVKFRVAPKHTCGKTPAAPPSRTFKVPYVDPSELFDLDIYRTGVIDTRKAMRVRLRKQVFNGIEIPDKTEVWCPGGCVITGEFSSRPKASIRGAQINPILRTVVIDQLRSDYKP